MRRLPVYWYVLKDAWETVQVELHGQYSMQRMRAFRSYSHSSSLARVLLVVLLTPLPCLIAVAIADGIALAPPEQGIGHSHAFWVRAEFAAFIFSHSIVEQIQYYVPRLGLSRLERLAISIPVSVLTCVATYAMAIAIGFPLPFTIPMLSMPWSVFNICSFWIVRGAFLAENREVLSEVLKYSLVLVCQMSMVLIYPLFYSAFSNLSSSAQTKFVLLLPLIKLVEKNLLHHAFTDQDDVKPELIIFNVEIFNALFAACCMQTSRSINTNIVIMVVDVLQGVIAVQDLNTMLVEVDRLSHKMQMKKGQLVATTMDILNCYPVRKLARVKSIAHILTAEERLVFVQRALQVLYFTEFVLLIEFTEVMIPVVYCIYLNVLFRLPNRAFYPQVSSMSDSELAATIENVFVYAALEFMSFLVLNVVLKRKLHVSAVYQLAFVLEKQWQMVQSKLILWVVLMLQSTLVHLGADYSFKFAWLRQPHSPAL